MGDGLVRLVSVRLWNSTDLDSDVCDRAFYGWVLPGVKNECFEKLREHLIFCSESDVQEMVSEMFSVADRGNVETSDIDNTKMGVLVAEIGFKIDEVKIEVTSRRTDLIVHFIKTEMDVENQSVIDLLSTSSQSSQDLDSRESDLYYVERLRDFFDGF